MTFPRRLRCFLGRTKNMFALSSGVNISTALSAKILQIYVCKLSVDQNLKERSAELLEK